MINPNVKGSAVKRGVQAAGVRPDGRTGVANKSPMGPTNRKSEPALFSGGIEELVSFDGDGKTQLSKGRKKPFKSSQSLTEDFGTDSLAQKREKFRTQRPGGPMATKSSPNEVGGGLY